MGTKPSLWTPTGISGETINTWSMMTQPLSAVKGERRARRGDAERQPRTTATARPTASPARGSATTARASGQDVRRPVRGQEAGGRRDRPADLVAASGRQHQRQRRPPRSSTAARTAATCRPSARRCRRSTPCSAAPSPGDVGVGVAHATQEHPRHDQERGDELEDVSGANEKAKLDAPPGLDPAAREQARPPPCPTGGACMKPTRRRRQHRSVHGRPGRLAANVIHQNIIASAFACDITASPACSTATTRS